MIDDIQDLLGRLKYFKTNQENEGDRYGSEVLHHVIQTLTELSEKVEKYNELIMAVERKHPGESRFATALRYIQERESESGHPAQDSS